MSESVSATIASLCTCCSPWWFVVSCCIHVVCRLDVSLRMSPEALVGRDVRVYWPMDDAWFWGTVSSYNPGTAQHTVSMLANDHLIRPLHACQVMLGLL